MPSVSLSVVVVSLNDPELLDLCLEALVPQLDDTVEVLVVRDSEKAPASFRRRHPGGGLRWIDAPHRATVPEMRALGVQASHGDIVALLEDDCLVTDGWCRHVLEAHRGPEVAIGGAIEPGPYSRSRDWAVYFHEYSRFMRPLSEDAPLAGTHVAYKREPLLNALARHEDLHDVFVHDAWSREGRPMRADDRLVVLNVNAWPPGALTTVPYHHGRALAARRFADRPLPARLARAAATPLLPGVQLARMISTIVTRRRFATRFVRALPSILIFGVSWSAGEIMGCLLGDGGSASRWR